MESRRYHVSVDEAAYRNWRTIGVLENLTADEDIAKFLVTLYTNQKQKEGEECMARCGHCHCPLTLYCNTCQCPSHLALPSHPSSPSQYSLPSAIPAQVLDTSAVTTDIHHTSLPLTTGLHQTSLMHPHRPLCDIKDEEDTVDSLQGDEGSKCDFDDMKTQSADNVCDEESRSAEPALTVHFAPTVTRSKHKTSAKSWRKNLRKTSGLGVMSQSTNSSTHAKKTLKCKVSGRGMSTRSTRSSMHGKNTLKHTLLNTNTQSAQKRRKEAPLKTKQPKKKEEEADLEWNSEGICNNRNQDTTHQMQRKRKPCASQDLEKGHILPAEERRLAQIHVYDQSFIDSHKLEEESTEDMGVPEKRHTRQVLIVKTLPWKRGRKKNKAGSNRSPAKGQSSSSEEDTVDYQIENLNETSLEPSCDNIQFHPAAEEAGKCSLDIEVEGEKYPTLKHILSSPKVDSQKQDEDGSRKDRQPFRILVSAQKILPLLTSSGNPAHNYYSYFECAHCRKAFVHKRAFNSHVQAHVDKRIYKCNFCDRSFERPCNRIIHEKRHKYECEVCGYKYLEYSMIKEHMKLHSMKCPRCPFETSDFCTFKKHKSTCEFLKPSLQCEICGVRLKSQKALSFHIAAIHQNHRPFKCTLCDKSFVLQTKLNSHIRDRHTEGGKRFHCDKCGYRSFQAHSLKIHQMCVHSNERPYKCTHCPSAFARKVYLTIHLRKHTGEKPHRCSECLQTFTQRPSLTRHIRTHHQGDTPVGKKMIDFDCAQ